MLHRLIEYADAHGIDGKAGFSSKRIRFLFQFTPQGKFLSVHDYGASGEEFSAVPHLQFSGDDPTRQFLVDTIEFLALYPNSLTVLKNETNGLLSALEKESDYDEIKVFSEEVLDLLKARKFAELRTGGFKNKWIKLLQREGRGSHSWKKIKKFLKEDGPVEMAFGNCDFKRLELADATKGLLDDLRNEPDIDEIRSISEKVMTLLNEKQYLKLREKDMKKEWVTLLKKGGRGNRTEINEFISVVDMVFKKNKEFKRIGKHQFCLRLLEQASEAEPLLGVIAKAMDDPVVLKKIHDELQSKTPAPRNSNNASFSILEEKELRILVKEHSWRGWWESKHKDLTDSVGPESARCFLSGAETKPILTHPKIKGLGRVGGNAETSLVSFDKGSSAFQSYGFLQGENAAVSTKSAVKYTSAINYMLNHQHHRLAGTEIVYWYTRDVSGKEDIIQTAFNGWGSFEEDEDLEENYVQKEAAANIDAKKFLKSVANGERHDLRDVEYCALTLQGNRGRAVAQNWMEGRFVELAANIEQWFSDLEIIRLSGVGTPKPPKLETLITCLLKERKPKQKYLDWVKPVASFRDAIWRAAVGGRSMPFPENTVRLILQRIRESTLTDEWENTIQSDGEHVGMRRARLYARIGLIKAFLIRNHHQEVYMVDREKNKKGVYWLGCLFAELANLQRAAHQGDGGVNIKSTIVDRFYTTASTCPKLVHGRLIAQSQHHLKKLEGKRPSAAHAISDKIASISEKIDLNDVPDLLPLPEQSWFALGYYQQIAVNNRERAEAIAKKKANKTKGDSK